MATEQKTDVPWPSEPKYFQWKGTLSIHGSTTNVLAHCKPRKQDVFIKIKSTQNDDHDTDIDQFTENTKNLINIKHENLLTPIHAFVHKSEIWVIYPRRSGGPLIEILSSHYPNGIPDESIVSCILYDVATGLHNLHKHQQCHRNIRASSIHIDIDNGCALLSEFGELKEIKWKHKTNRRNTMVSPEREPFTDPLILMNDDSASWYAGDIYAFGITALQLTYGSTPPLNTKNILAQKMQAVTCDAYDKKCPFSKTFEQLIKGCCASLKDRISINKLIEHKFFKLRCERSFVKQTFGHILKSTEKRINSSLNAPISFNINGMNNENIQNNINQQNNNNDNGNQLTTANGTNFNDTNNNPDSHEAKENASNPDWSFSVSLSRASLNKNIITPIEENTPTTEPVIDENQTAHHGPTAHMKLSKFNDPTQKHNHFQPVMGSQHSASEENADNQIPENQKNQKRKYRISFSESISHDISHDVNDDNQEQINAQFQDQPNQPQTTHGRFKVEFPSRNSQSESGTVPTPMEASETWNDQEHDAAPPTHESDEENENENEIQQQTNQEPKQTKEFGRFVVVQAAHDAPSADEDDNLFQQQPNNQNNQNNINHNNNNNGGGQQRQQQQSQQQHQQQQPVQQAQLPQQSHPPTTQKSEWDSKQCSQWVGSLGEAYKQYMKLFEDNGIDGAFLSEIDDAILQEIVTSALHRKKIVFAWGKL